MCPPLTRNITCILILVLMLISLSISGCSEDSPRPLMIPDDQLLMTTTITAAKPAIEIGESIDLRVVVRNEDNTVQNGIKLLLQVNMNDIAIGMIDQDTVVTDSQEPNGIFPPAQFISHTVGEVELQAIRLSEFSTPLETSTLDFEVQETIYNLESIVDQRQMVANQQYRIGAFLRYDWNDGSREVITGKRVYFRTYELNNPGNPFGTLLPVEYATTDTIGIYGVADTIYFHHQVSGTGVLEATYRNIQGTEVLQDTIHFMVL